MNEYNHKKIEARWQRVWEKKKVFSAKNDSKQKKFYGLIEFPYPSGDGLHVGHIRSNTAMDAICRKRRMEGHNVLYPIGWDAFGLPTENYAIKTGIQPAVVTKKNTDIFRRQLKELGFSFDWSREINTTDPKYYKWTQWIFLQLYKNGLAYKKKMPINWCPSCKIGLANEEVIDGKCERCGAQTEKKEKEQWMLAITKYADRLDRDLDEAVFPNNLRNLPKKILVGTRNQAKVKMVRNAFPQSLGIEFLSLEDVSVDDSKLVEGNDSRENARKKASFYFKKTGIPTISTDHIQWIEKYPKNKGFIVHIRKLVNPKSPRASDEEVGQWIEDFVDKYGESKSCFYYAVGYADEKGALDFEVKQKEYILQKQKSAKVEEGYPFDRYLKDPKTGEFRIEQPFQEGFGLFADFIKNEFLNLFAKPNNKGVDYLEKIKIQQRNWIGRSEGVNLRSKVKDLDIYFEMYDSVPQTHMAQTFTVIAPEHPMLFDLVKGTEYEKPVMEKAREMIKKRASGIYEKTGEMDGIFTGRFIEYLPAKRDLPIWVASFVVADYGTGIVNCSFHDERDFTFAKKFNIPLHPVTEPLFVKTSGVDAVKKDSPLVDRQAITAIVKHWSEDKYIGLKWKKVDWDTFITGGVEKGQTPEEAARTEIMEETGYKNIKLIKELPRFHSQFFHVPKNVNRFAHFSSFLFQLADGEKNEISPDEKANHDVVWLTPKELEKFRLPEGHRFVWESMLGIEKPIIKNGILTEPAEFKGREWNEAREDIINYLVEKGYATRAVNYKLRDWVFSRQHYWGEPIPMVFCDSCANRKYNFVFIHGYKGSCKRNWKPWLKNELEERGHKVFAPELPNTDQPSVEEQADYILKNAKLDEDTILIGHSLGGAVLLRILEKTKNKIAKAVFVDSVLRPAFNDKERPALLKAHNWKFNFNKIRKNAEEFVVLADATHNTIPKEQLDELASNLGAIYVTSVPVERHFTAEEEPEILKLFENEGWTPVPEKDLPIELPKVEKYQPTDTGESPLAVMTKWVNTKCPRCGGKARRETDTMPNWAGSSWYYLAYTLGSLKSKVQSQKYWNQQKLKYWLPVDWYNGGMEHTTLHLLYSRFWHKFLFDIGVVPTSEPYQKRTSHGMILAEGGVKMSKSKGNVINPDDLVERFGADALRVYEMFMGPFDQTIAWNTDGLVGTRRFLEKVWRMGEKLITYNKSLITKKTDKENELQTTNYKLQTILHRTVKKVTEDIEAMRFNTAISSLMICANEMDSAESVPKELFEMYLKVLSPFAPHICEEIWSELGHPPSRGRYGGTSKTLIMAENWPAYDPAKIVDEEVMIVVQINGKMRGQFSATSDISEQEAIEKAKSLLEIKKWLAPSNVEGTEGKQIKKAIFVKGRLVNIVI